MAKNIRPKGLTDLEYLEYEKSRSTKVGECWLWPLVSDAYGNFHKGQTHLKAHRVAFALLNGVELPLRALDGTKLEVQHICNRPACFNPDHLVWGRTTANARFRELCKLALSLNINDPKPELDCKIRKLQDIAAGLGYPNSSSSRLPELDELWDLAE